MGRPPKPAGEKRQLISVRFDPEARAAFERAAAASGRSMGAEIERRAACLADADDETIELVAAIVRDIITLQKRNAAANREDGKRWHKDLKTWSAVAEMLALGPIQDRKPLREDDLEAQKEGLQPLNDLTSRRMRIVFLLSEMGVSAASERTIAKGLLGTRNSRDTERAGIDSLPDGDDKAEAIKLHDELRRLDDEIEEARANYRESMQPYWDREAAGRSMYRDYLQQEATRKRDAGEPYDAAHLFGMFRTWL